jgi:hypothetical protein
MRVVRAELLEISLVPVPASATALVSARALRTGAAAMLRSLPAISAQAIERALAHAGRASAPQAPIMSLSDSARTAAYAGAWQQRSRATWACGQARQAEARDYSREQRQAELAQLRGAGEPQAQAPARRRLRPYGG